MADISYDKSNLTIIVSGTEDVQRALGDLKNKTPAAVKVTINATARQARKLMIAEAKARYAVNAKGQQHLKDLVQRKKATNTSLNAEIHIASMRNDLGYFKYSPTGIFTGRDVFTRAADVVVAKVLKASGMKPLSGDGTHSKGFLIKYKSGHIGMGQRLIGSNSDREVTENGYPRWRNADGKIEKVQTMGSPSATAMHHTIWPIVEPDVEDYLQARLNEQVQKVLARAGKA